eukprot:2945914-Rhodomonas_salina.3
MVLPARCTLDRRCLWCEVATPYHATHSVFDAWYCDAVWCAVCSTGVGYGVPCAGLRYGMVCVVQYQGHGVHGAVLKWGIVCYQEQYGGRKACI